MEAFEEIVKDHSPKIYYFLRRMGLEHDNADEILQDVFIQFWRDLKNGQGLEVVNFRLYQHAIKKVLTFLNRDCNILLEDDSVKDKLVLVLKHHEGFDFEDISDFTGISLADVRKRFRSALKV